MFRLPRHRPRACTPDADGCATCPLTKCPAGWRVAILCLGCAARDAERLRALGLVEGTSVDVVNTRSGVLLDVRGSRLALGVRLAAAITVRPIAP